MQKIFFCLNASSPFEICKTYKCSKRKVIWIICDPVAWSIKMWLTDLCAFSGYFLWISIPFPVWQQSLYLQSRAVQPGGRLQRWKWWERGTLYVYKNWASNSVILMCLIFNNTKGMSKLTLDNENKSSLWNHFNYGYWYYVFIALCTSSKNGQTFVWKVKSMIFKQY